MRWISVSFLNMLCRCWITKAFWVQMEQISFLYDWWRMHGFSVPAKAGNVDRDYVAAHFYFMKNYFWPSHMERPGTHGFGPGQSDHALERPFGMSELFFNWIFTWTVAKSSYLRKWLFPDFVGRIGIPPLLNVIFAMQQVAYGPPGDLGNNIFYLSEIAAALYLSYFCISVTTSFKRNLST